MPRMNMQGFLSTEVVRVRTLAGVTALCLIHFTLIVPANLNAGGSPAMD